MINRHEWVGKQMEDLEKVLKQTADAEVIITGLHETHSKVLAVEDKLLQRQLHASDPKSYRDEMKLYSKLLWFSGEIGSGAGDIRNTEDFGPTNQQLVVYDILKRRLDEVREEYDRLISETIPALNKTLLASGHGVIITSLK